MSVTIYVSLAFVIDLTLGVARDTDGCGKSQDEVAFVLVVRRIVTVSGRTESFLLRYLAGELHFRRLVAQTAAVGQNRSRHGEKKNRGDGGEGEKMASGD